MLELLLFAGAGELYSGQTPESKQKYFKVESVRFVHHLNSWEMRISQHLALSVKTFSSAPSTLVWGGGRRTVVICFLPLIERKVEVPICRLLFIESVDLYDWKYLTQIETFFAVSWFPLNPIVRAEYFNLKGGGDDNNKSGDKSLLTHFFTLMIVVGFEVAHGTKEKGTVYLSEPSW